jgi:hypothetical protein
VGWLCAAKCTTDSVPHRAVDWNARVAGNIRQSVLATLPYAKCAGVLDEVTAVLKPVLCDAKGSGRRIPLACALLLIDLEAASCLSGFDRLRCEGFNPTGSRPALHPRPIDSPATTKLCCSASRRTPTGMGTDRGLGCLHLFIQAHY